MSKHTPGPWIIEGVEWVSADDGGHRHLMVNAPNFTIALVQADEDDAEQEANAQLIAAAPDLFAALEALVAWQLGKGKRPNIEDARAAIAKARGGK